MQASRPGRARVALLLAMALSMAGQSANAHEQLTPIGGDSILVQTTGLPDANQFSFSRTGEINISVITHDPSVTGTAVLVRGVGANAGRTEVINLSPVFWSASASGGFEYQVPALATPPGGITHAEFRSGELLIQGSGANWSWDPAGPQDEVWVHFRIEDEWYCSRFSPAGSTITTNTVGHFAATNAPAPGACPSQVCGNGVLEIGEQCDDGNLSETDGCNNDCTLGQCTSQSFATTYEAIQSVIFDTPITNPSKGCSSSFPACHNPLALGGAAGGLDLSTAAASYPALLGADGLGAPSCQALGCAGSLLKRVEPGDPITSLLYTKLAAKTLCDPLDPASCPSTGGGSSMPTAGFPVIEQHLEALRLWIRGGAPLDISVEGTAPLLGTCLPPPAPLKIPVPDPPVAGVGIQLQQTPYVLSGTNNGQGEDEICLATFYDLTATNLVPASADRACTGETFTFRKGCSNDLSIQCSQDSDCGAGNTCEPAKNVNNPQNRCFPWHHETLLQDPQSHHSLIFLYTGAATPNDPGWGQWTYKFEPGDPSAALNGQPCDPTTNIDPTLGYNRGCSSSVVSSIACNGFGPADAANFSLTGGGNLPQVSGSQEPFFVQDLASGVFGTLPQRAIVVWNSHAFNLTPNDTTMAQYLNIDFATPPDQINPLQTIFMAQWIFAQYVPPFGTQEICATETLPQGAQLFELSSHTHERGRRWRAWAPPNTPCQPGCPDPGDVCAGASGFCGCDLDKVCSASSSEAGQFCTVNGDCTGGTCDLTVPLCADLGYPRTDQPIYFSTDYSDPLQLGIDPPISLDSPVAEDRTFLFCSLFDNGSTPDSPPVKRQSTSPQPPCIPIDLFGACATPEAEAFFATLLEPVLGGPCPDKKVACMGPTNQGMLCGLNPDGSTRTEAERDAACGGAGLCDACPVHGGVTTGDEMFIWLGDFTVPAPEPSALWMAAAALGTVGFLGSRRRRK